MLRASLISLLALGVVAQEPAPQAATPAPVAAPVATPAPKPEEAVLAKVGGEAITEIDVLANIYKAGGEDVLASYRANIGA